MSVQAEKIDQILAGVRVMPVVVIHDVEHALPLADALLEGGISAIEVTLRTASAMEAVKAIADARPEMTVGTGTVVTPDDLRASLDAGARFFVSPGLTDLLARAAETCEDGPCALLPGTATASEVMRAVELGFERLKFFPAEQAGGISMLKAIGAPLQTPRFCPTGGIKPGTAGDYLALGNVFCIGGSWITPAAMMAEGDWAGITALAREASTL